MRLSQEISASWSDTVVPGHTYEVSTPAPPSASAGRKDEVQKQVEGPQRPQLLDLSHPASMRKTGKRYNHCLLRNKSRTQFHFLNVTRRNSQRHCSFSMKFRSMKEPRNVLVESKKFEFKICTACNSRCKL